jgi:hypothetical protein
LIYGAVTRDIMQILFGVYIQLKLV